MANRKAESFELKPILVKQSVYPFVLEGPDMRELLRAINGVVDSKYKGNSHLKVLRLVNVNGIDRIVGSNSFIRPVIDQVLPQYRAIKPEEVERTLRECDFLGIKGNHHIDYGVVLDFSGNNHELALEVFQGLPEELRDLDRLPAVMLDYGLANSKKGDYSVAPVYQEGTELRTAKILSQPTGVFSKDNKGLIRTGLPSKLNVGERTLYTASQNTSCKESLGISRFGLYKGLSVVACDVSLAVSVDVGWVVSIASEE